ncbi:GLPGLI family protein [Polaribacter batillariae]|uniref:GLPGLI family protein n=1 Tax=Polaribacter batillariae TaxID=2808900 RepID=A0ABX7SRJ9_9FLAO|nr:GLPGLI family protein [Polaribacter batillariae]
MLKVIENSKDVFFVLKIKNNESFFYKKEKLNNDFDKGINMTETLSGKGIYYSNINTNEILNQKESFGNKFLISYPKIEWILTQEKKKIGNYICYKATTIKKVENKRGIINKKITAWYTLDIPYKFGPKEFSNLPGLILELQEGRLTFTVDKIKLNLNKKIEINKPTEGKKLSLKKYNETIKKIVLDYRKNR